MRDGMRKKYKYIYNQERLRNRLFGVAVTAGIFSAVRCLIRREVGAHSPTILLVPRRSKKGLLNEPLR